MHFLPTLSSLIFCGVLSSPALAVPTSFLPHLVLRGTASSSSSTTSLQFLFDGNVRFQKNIATSDPSLLHKLVTEGQNPPAIFIGCSDSRVSENQVFDAKPGTLFVQRNIANQFLQEDTNANSALMYAVSSLGVQHVIVMGHYGCGGVAAATQPRPTSGTTSAVQKWIQPIRDVYEKSKRAEVVALRMRLSKRATETLAIDDPGFMALVEENVKSGVAKLAASDVITDAWKANKQIFVHGWVYSLTTGAVKDLSVTVNPPTMNANAVVSAPAEALEAAVTQLKVRHSHA